MRWYNYIACFFAGVFLIHIVPHLAHGFSLTNVLGVLVSLGGGCLLLWTGRFSIKNPWAVVLLLAGMASVLIYAALRPHHRSTTTTMVQENSNDLQIGEWASLNFYQGNVRAPKAQPKPA